MKHIIYTFLFVFLANTNSLLAHIEDRSLSSQVKQQVKTTETCKLLTANSDNLSCYLMMNPSIEEGTKALGKVLENFEGNEAGLERAVVENSEVEAQRKEILKKEKQAADCYQLATEARVAGKRNEAASWSWAAQANKKKEDCQAKAIKDEVNGSTELANKWNKVAMENQLAFESFIKSAEAYAVEIPTKIVDGARWKNVGLSKFKAAEQMGKAIEAEINGHLFLASKWRVAAGENQLAFESSIKAIEAFAIGNQKVASNLDCAFVSKLQAADQMAAAIEAETNNNTVLASKWTEAVKESQLAFESFIKATEVYKTAETHYWTKKDKTSESIAYQNIALSRLRAAEQMNNAIVAELAGNETLDNQWRAVAKQNQLAAEDFIQGCYCFAECARGIKLIPYVGPAVHFRGQSWNNAGLKKLKEAEQMAVEVNKRISLYDRAESLQAKASEAEDAGKTMLAESYREAVTVSQRVAE